MPEKGLLLVGTAASIAFIHVLAGPDHYLPFIAMSKVGRWSLRKTALVTVLCGAGHVLSSVVLGFLGMALGAAVAGLVSIEAVRGDLAAWLLIGFGAAYCGWGIYRATRGRPYRHLHLPEDAHGHGAHPGEPHAHAEGGRSLTPWILFTIFVFGPCEPLIPLLMYPALAGGGLALVLPVVVVFSTVTIGTMLAVVMASYLGLSRLAWRRLEPYSHALAGFAILLCGGAIKFLGL